MKLLIKYIGFTLVVSSICVVLSCNNPTKSSAYDDIVVNIVSTVIEQRNSIIDYESVWLKYAKINFTVENTGTKNING